MIVNMELQSSKRMQRARMQQLRPCLRALQLNKAKIRLTQRKRTHLCHWPKTSNISPKLSA